MTPAEGTTWPAVLNRLLAGEDLTAADAGWVMGQVMQGEASPARLAAFLVGLRAKGESVAEMLGLAEVMLAHAHRVDLPGPALDIVGTGGDGAQTVNISTMSSIVAAATGVPVVKHGNRAASSRAGSADTLAALGVSLDLTPEQVVAVGRRCGITFCFAQTFHPSMRHAAAVRRDLGIATAFNFLGPLTNPAQPAYAAIGVADARMAPLLAGVFAERGLRAAVFRGDDGLDEVTPATTTSLWWVARGQSRSLSLDPRALGVATHPVDALRGGDAQHNAEVARRVLAGEPGPVRDAVLLNTGVALAVVEAGGLDAQEPGDDEELAHRVRRGMDRAAEAIDSGAGTRLLQDWAAATAEARSATP